MSLNSFRGNVSSWLCSHSVQTCSANNILKDSLLRGRQISCQDKQYIFICSGNKGLPTSTRKLNHESHSIWYVYLNATRLCNKLMLCLQHASLNPAACCAAHICRATIWMAVEQFFLSGQICVHGWSHSSQDVCKKQWGNQPKWSATQRCCIALLLKLHTHSHISYTYKKRRQTLTRLKYFFFAIWEENTTAHSCNIHHKWVTWCRKVLNLSQESKD